MYMIKVIITGPQCSGKSTIARMLERCGFNIRVIDEDKEINLRNGGKSPSDWSQWNYKWEVLRPEIQKDILQMDRIIFLTSYFDPELILIAKEKGFKIIQLETPAEILGVRNRDRMEQGIDDAAYGWSINLPYHKEIKEKGLVDVSINSGKHLSEVHREILVAIGLLRTSSPFKRNTQTFANS